MPSADHDPAEASSRRRRRLAIAVLLFFNLTSYSGVIDVFSPRLREYFSLTFEQWGTMTGLGSLGQTVSLLLVGLVIARFGVRRITELSLGGVGGCFLLIGQGASLLALKVALGLQGLFSGFSRSSLPAYLVALYPSHKRRMISLQLTCGSVMGIVVPLWANQLLIWSREGGQEALARLFFSPFLVAGCVVLCGWAVLSFSRQPAFQSVQTAGEHLRLRPLLGIRPLAIVLLVTLHASADGTVYSFLPMFMDHHFQELPLAPAWALVGHNVAYLITRTLLSLLPEGMGQRAILTLAGPIGGSLLLVMLWQGNALSVPLIYTLASLFYAAEFPVLLSEISSRSMAHFAAVMSGGYLVSNLTSFLLMKGTGRLVDTTGDFRVALSVAACGFIAFGLVAAVAGLGKSPPSRNTTTSPDFPQKSDPKSS